MVSFDQVLTEQGISDIIMDRSSFMKKIFCLACFTIVTIFHVYSQTWTVQKDGWQEEFTIISKEQFDRIVRANETIALAVSFNFFDATEVDRDRVIRGTRPRLNGYYYMTVRPIPHVDSVRSIVIYGHSETGRMVIIFYNSLLPGTISLRFNWNEYVRQYNQLIRLVNNE